MKITFPLPIDEKMHRFCIVCKVEGATQVVEDGLTKYHCDACGATSERAIYFNDHKAWLDDDDELWHESSGVFVKNSEGKYLFYKRTGYPYKLTVPSGHVDRGESGEVAAARELEEETGIKAVVELLATEEVQGDSCSAGADVHLWNAYTASIDGDGSDAEVLEEGEKALWLTIDEALAQGTVFVVEYIINKHRSQL